MIEEKDIMKRKAVYMPPQAKITIIIDFDLSKIEETFQYHVKFKRRSTNNVFNRLP